MDDPPEHLYFFSLLLSKQGWQCHHLVPSDPTQAVGMLLPSSIRQYFQMGDVILREMLGVDGDDGVKEQVLAGTSEPSRWLALLPITLAVSGKSAIIMSGRAQVDGRAAKSRVWWQWIVCRAWLHQCARRVPYVSARNVWPSRCFRVVGYQHRLYISISIGAKETRSTANPITVTH